MKQWIIITKIAGDTADVVMLKFAKWAAKPRRQGSSRPRVDNGDAERLIQTLQSHATMPPVIFHCQYLDMWSMGDLFDRLFPSANEDMLCRLSIGDSELACYRVPDDGVLLTKLASYIDKIRSGDPSVQEDRWFAQTLYNAATAWEGLYTKAVIVTERRVIGGSLTDLEIETGCRVVPSWL